MDLTADGGGSFARAAGASASSSLLVLLLLRALLLHAARDFWALAQLLLVQLVLQLAAGSRSSLSRRRPAPLDPRSATLDAARRLATLYVGAQALRHFGPLLAFLLQHARLLLQQLQRWRRGDANDALPLLLGYVLVAGVSADEYGALLRTLLLLGAALGLQLAAESPALRAAAVDADASPLSLAIAAGFAALLALLTPESVARAQQIANDRASADGGVVSASAWALCLLLAAAAQFTTGFFARKLRSLPSVDQTKAQLVTTSTGVTLAVAVAFWERGWFRGALSAMTSGLVLYVLLKRWRRMDTSFGGTGPDTEAYLDTYRSSAGLEVKGGLVDGASHVLGVLWSKRASRQMLIFLSVNVAFMFVELGVGLYTNSLGLMGDAGHMLFDNGALVIGLAASYIGQLPPDAKFTYGYGRVEVLSGFLNSLLLLVVSFHLLTEAASRFLDPPEVATDHLLLTSTAGLVVNLVGLFFFHDHVHHGHSHSEHSGGCGSGHGHSHGNTHHQAHGEDASEDGHHGGNSNMYGVYLHVLADTLGSVGVIISSILIQLYEWHVADSASSALISLLILGSTLPLLRDTARQLLQGAPQDREANVNAALQEVQASIPGVERVAQWNIWHHAGDMCVATLHLEISTSANEQQVLQQTRTIFRRHARLDKFLSVQISKPQELSAMGLDGVGAEQSMFPFSNKLAMLERLSTIQDADVFLSALEHWERVTPLVAIRQRMKLALSGFAERGELRPNEWLTTSEFALVAALSQSSSRNLPEPSSEAISPFKASIREFDSMSPSAFVAWVRDHIDAVTLQIRKLGSELKAHTGEELQFQGHPYPHRG
ncbi:Cation Diffusion Facilitator (CDF) Family [Phytophthora cinnamomi]|uniref:Cation Diffusion Facilitator (CDF) Family n=1 Tax=Phytophthora cinnamomi TaxID=4785 RepID=UPI00355A4E83|nr:Cation Diffusion Facilitator (CDF) Family [Phytophthora cinnamomi]